MSQPNTVLDGQNVSLRNIEPGDLEQLRKWRNMQKYRQYFREHRDISRKMQENWYQKSVLEDERVQMFAITEKQSSRLLGACGLCYIDERNRSADFSIYIGADDLYIDELYAPESGALLLKYGFNELELHRIWAEIYATDTAKQKLLPQLGFVLDGVHKEAQWLENNSWTDCLFYGKLSENK